MAALIDLSCDRPACIESARYDTPEGAYDAGWRGSRFIDFREPYITHWSCPAHSKELWR